MNKIELIKLSELNEYENNPRNNGNAIEVVKNSIKEFGFTNPILIDDSNVIIAGHTRALAAQELNITDVPCIRLSNLNAQQIKAYRLVDNKTAEISTWDFEKLFDEINELEQLDYSLVDFGFGDIDGDFLEGVGDNCLDDVLAPEDKQEKKLVCPNCGHIGTRGDF